MIRLPRFSASLLTSVFLFGATPSDAATPAHFGRPELDSLLTVMKPNLSSLRLDGDRGVLSPAPSIDFLGLGQQEFRIDLGGTGELANLRFNDLQAESIGIYFEEGALRLTLAIRDKKKGLRSSLGAIHFENAALSLALGFVEEPNGDSRLSVLECRLTGGLSGTGLLAPRFIVKELRSLAERKISEKVAELLAKPKTQDGIETGLLKWAQFSRDKTLQRIVPGSASITPGGVRFDAE
jgi:hypothetical protein